ncbi:MAG: hypothetical protein F6K41_40480, partial [Symploca sp. SIO3E6]|nr:hypothetical protein [Caldora sp. SIO3E6]
MNTAWMFFDIDSSPIWQLIKHIKRILNLNKQTNSEELAKWRLPPPPIRGDGGMGGWGDGEMGRWGDGEMGRWGDGEMGRWGE